MKIRKIEYENFRNFKDSGSIKCSTDGRVTIIYGKNGDGKTTLHQLFQWVFYGDVKFNKTATSKLYNLSFENDISYSKTFDVKGSIEFEHNGELYRLTRTCKYKKKIDTILIAQDLRLSKQDNDHNWKNLDRPQEVIEKLLPSGLAEYFFFDGESMIADLRVKGRESANKLRKALYSMFDLDLLELALAHIGSTDLSTTVLGQLYKKKAPAGSDKVIDTQKAEIENIQRQISDIKQQIELKNNEKAKQKALVSNISENIGQVKSKVQYEKERKYLKNSSIMRQQDMKNDQHEFGNTVMAMFPQLLIAKAVDKAAKILNFQAQSTKVPAGLNKELLSYLLDTDVDHCICGRHLSAEEKQHLKMYFNYLPPLSYASLYQNFIAKTQQLRTSSDAQKKLKNCIQQRIKHSNEAVRCNEKIRALDEDERKSPEIEDLVVNRQQAEKKIDELDELISQFKKQLFKYEIYRKKLKADFDKLTDATETGREATLKIEIMEEVKNEFELRLQNRSKHYSQKLETNIQWLLNQMLTSHRSVTVSEEFAVKVTDSFNDESKSEGQFAVVSFAYIGGILNMLKEEECLQEKEYPLVLDGPFSKLDQEQRQNVIDMLPNFAPQVIIFSKDDLHSDFDENYIGHVYTLQSNDEKNIATVKEGKLWK
ncbi:MAG: AAA family ATPase [Fastidiosipilaceae bacterium]|nr:AAA family ATPase [Clostridiaceae bacterium]